MGSPFKELMTKKSDIELMEYINNIERYRPEILIAVMDELKERRQNFSDEELKSINEKIEKQKEIEEEEGIIGGSSKSLRKNVVKDPNAPLLYSQVAIMAFSTIFTVIFGSILLSLNIDNKTKKLKVIGIGVLFSASTILIANIVPHSISYVFFFNGIGGYVLSFDFWNKYIGRETKYRSKPIWIPLILSIVIIRLLLIPFI